MLEQPKAIAHYQCESSVDIMADQQATLTEGELGWLAGIIDGEGTISLYMRKKAWKGWKGIGVDMHVAVSNTDGRIIEKTAELFRRLTGSEPLVYQLKKKSPVYKADGTTYVNPKTFILNVSVNRMTDILAVLRALEPHLVGDKAARARLIMRFIERRMNRKTKHTLRGMALFDKYDWETLAEFYQLNGRTVPPEVQRVLNEHEQKQALGSA